MILAAIDTETKSLVTDWSQPHLAGLACMCVVILDEGRGTRRCAVYSGSDADLERARRDLAECERLVSWNGIAFDLPLLAALGLDLGGREHVDLLSILLAADGRRWSLDDVARATLARGKSGIGHHAPEMWERGELAALHTYCLDDTALTLDLYLFARHHGFLWTPAGDGECRPVAVSVDGRHPQIRVATPRSTTPATERQIAYIQRLQPGWLPTLGLTKQQASAMIEALVKETAP